MEEQFVPYELAIKLKKLGFDERCLAGYYDNEKNLCFFGFHKNSEREPIIGERFATAPLWQQAFDWFREKHNLNIQPFAVWESEYEEIDFIKNKPSFYITDDFIYNKNKSIENSDKFKTYQEARQACLENIMEMLEEQLNLYIEEKHTQEECIGFIDGYNKAKEEGVFTLEDMEKAISEVFKAQQEGYKITTKEIINQIQQSKNN